MNVTRDVILDLWPLHRSGEASPDTRRLVEEFLEQDPEFAHLVRKSDGPWAAGDDLPPPALDSELTLLHRTRRMLRIRDALFWVALFLSLTPFSVYHTSWGSGWLIRDQPWVACGLGLGATLLWTLYCVMRRRLRVSGL